MHISDLKFHSVHKTLWCNKLKNKQGITIKPNISLVSTLYYKHFKSS